MKFVDFNGTNLELVAPKGMEEEIYPIKAQCGTQPNGCPYIIVALKPNEADLKALQDGMPLFICVLSSRFAPMSSWTANSDGSMNFEPEDLARYVRMSEDGSLEEVERHAKDEEERLLEESCDKKD